MAAGYELSPDAVIEVRYVGATGQNGDTLNVDSQQIRPNLVAGQDAVLPHSDRTLSRWFCTAAFSRTTVTYRNSPRNPVVGPGLAGGNPNGALGNSNFGIISSTRQNNREMQISLKYTF